MTLPGAARGARPRAVGRILDTVRVSRVDPSPSEISQPRPTRGLLEFVLLLVGAEVCRHLDFPVRAVGVLFAMGAVVVAVVMLTRLPRDARSQRTTVLLSLGTVAAAGLLLWHVGLLVVSPFFTDYERCLDLALTREAEQTCRQDLTDRLDSFRLSGG